MQNFKTEKKEIEIGKIYANFWNPNEQNQDIHDKLVESIKTEGFWGAILVRPKEDDTYEIIDGEHRWRICKSLGYTVMPCEVLIGEINDSQARQLTIIANRLRGKDNIAKLAKVFEEIASGQLSLLPFSEDEIENTKKLFKFDFSQYDEQKEISKTNKTNMISFSASEDIKELWQRCLDISKKDKKNLSVMLLEMINPWLEFNDLEYSKYLQEREEARILKVANRDMEKAQQSIEE